MTAGYILLALGAERYYEMALSAALSAKAKDPGRLVALIHDGQRDLTPYRPYFDDLIEMPVDDNYVGVANKLRLFDYAPYKENFFLDADCFIVKSDMDRHWAKFSAHDFNMAGDKRTSGEWYGLDIPEICQKLSIDYVCAMNSGAFYFKRNDAAKRVFDDAIRLYADSKSLLGVVHQGRSQQLADEPIFGAAMAMSKIDPVHYTSEEGSIMVTSWGVRKYEADASRDYVSVRKPRSMNLVDRFNPFTDVMHSPTILHFIGLKPRRLYDQLAQEFREQAGAPPAKL